VFTRESNPCELPNLQKKPSNITQKQQYSQKLRVLLQKRKNKLIFALMKTTKNFLAAAILIALTLAFAACGKHDLYGDTYESSSSSLQSSSSITQSSSEASSSSSLQSSSSITQISSSSAISSSSWEIIYGDPVEYGGEIYETVVIGNQTWFKRNLNVPHKNGDSWCYGEGGNVFSDDCHGGCLITIPEAEIQENCAKYGRLYDWNAAVAICPDGFHIPKGFEWDELLKFVDNENGGFGSSDSPYNSETAAYYLKTASDWENTDCQRTGNLGRLEYAPCNPGIDKYGFSALPGGSRMKHDNYGHYYIGAGGFGLWWTASEYNSWSAYIISITSSDWTYWVFDYKTRGYPVRCVKN
jgi:uncharacterized protein (TIGR02145 family)